MSDHIRQTALKDYAVKLYGELNEGNINHLELMARSIEYATFLVRSGGYHHGLPLAI